MKVFVSLLVIGFMFLCLTGCGAYVASPITRGLFTDVTGTLLVEEPSKVLDADAFGEASAQSILGLIASGDASVRTAAKNGRIGEIYLVDYHSQNVLGIYAKFTVYVYGKRVNDTSDLKSLDLSHDTSDLKSLDLSLPPTEAKSQAPPLAPTVDELLLKTLSPNPSYPTFDVDLEFQTDLDNQKFTEGLRAAFLNHGRILAPNAYISVRKTEDGDWLIFDSRHEQVFLVKKGGEKLTVITQTYVSSSR